MLNDKQTIYEALDTIEGLNVYQKRPVGDMTLPCAVFKRSDLSIMPNLDREIANQSQSYVIDIFAKTQEDVDEYLIEIEEIMRGMNYILGNAIDLEDPDNICHTNTIFNLS
jgi:hypothetical protein